MRDEATVRRDVLRECLGRLLLKSHRLSPDELPHFVERELRASGIGEPVVYVVNHEQTELVPLPPRDDLSPLAVDSTDAGRAYQSETELVSGSSPKRLWLPMRDGVDRLGILALTGEEFDEATITRCREIATVVAQLLISKNQFTDVNHVRRRSRAMTLGAEFRWSLLPPISFSCDAVSVAAALEPAYEVAGDAFDYALNGDELHIAVFDGMGHGLEASRLTNLTLAAYRHCRRRNLDIEATRGDLDGVIAEVFGAERFVTAQIAALDTQRGTLRIVNAGHPGPLLIRDKRIVTSGTTNVGVPLGVGAEFRQPAMLSTVELQPGDQVFFYTDGLTDAVAPDGTPFGLEGLVDTVNSACGDNVPPSETVRRLMHSVVAHRGATWRDDAMVVMVTWRPDALPKE
ncbi:MAG TPA: PP2C family protein-serine/threonine phosphatase [Ilumatobacteraceae bacterium]|nr:PP2C family protein-serine/threonine phosphatase [Ilumatobacteraceae bacterium]